MSSASYIFKRKESDCYYFRWTVPQYYSNFFGGRKELKHTLKTTDRERALKLAQHIAMLLERDILLTMSRNKSNGGYTIGAILEYFRRHADGSIEAKGIQTSSEPGQAEEDRKTLAALFKLADKSASPEVADPSSLKLSALIERYLAEAQKGERFTVKTHQETGSLLSLLVEIVGDKPVDTLTGADFSTFKTMLGKLPANRTKDPRYRSKSALELAGMAIPASDKMTVSTINKQLRRIAGLFRWAVNNHYVKVNLATGLPIATKVGRVSKGRATYTDADAQRLLAALAAGEHGSADVPWKKWMVMLGLYSGARLNELAQLRCVDFKEVGGIPAFDITNEGLGMRLKTPNSKRTIPVHPALVDAGLLAYVNEQRTKGEERLFPQLTLYRDGYGKLAGNWFSKWRLKLGIARDFHSLRHSFITKLREADVSSEDISDLVGHSRGRTETQRTYMKSASIARLHAAISKLSYGT